MTKTKQWILTVILTAVAVSALFFGVMISESVYSVAQAETLYADVNNSLLDESRSIDGHTAVPYEITNWTFGGIAPEYPRLEHGEENLSDGSGILTFTLLKRESGGNINNLISDGFRGDWSRFFNKYMPAGEYTVTFKAQAVNLSSHVHWWNGENHEETSCPEFSKEITFKVEKAPITVNEADVNGQVDRIALSSLKVNKVTDFFKTVNGLGVEYVTDDARHADNEAGYWKDSYCDKYYDAKPVYSFNLLRMKNGEYYTAGDSHWTVNFNKYFANADEFTVYYKVSLPMNYVDFPVTTTENDRYDHYFTVQVYKEINKPTIVSKTYTGMPLTPVFDTDEANIKYYELSNSAMTYLHAGKYDVSVRIKDEYKNVISWAGEAADKQTTTVPFNVTYIANYWIKTPTIMSWKYGEFDSSINFIDEEVRYGYGTSRHTVFELNENGERTGKFYTEQEIGAAMPIGTYELETTFVSNSTDYSSIVATITPFKVFPMDNYWAKTPITSWVYGNDPTESGALKVEARISESAGDGYVYTYFKSKIENGQVVIDNSTEFDSIEKIKVNGNIPVGVYFMRVRFVPAEDELYGGLDTNFRLTVEQAENSWTLTPNVTSWALGEKQNLPVGEAAFGDVKFVVTDSVGKEMFNSSVKSDWIYSCQSGWYKLVASVEGNDDYKALPAYEVEFRVFPATQQSQKAVETTATLGSDETINVRITAGVIDGTTATLTFVSNDDENFKASKQILEANGYVVGTAFTLALQYESQTVFPDGTVEVRITIPKNLVGKTGLQVVNINNGAVETLGARASSDGTIVFRTNNLGTHYFVYSSEQGSTGIGFIIAIIAIVVVALALVVVAIVVVRRSHKDEQAVAEELAADDSEEE